VTTANIYAREIPASVKEMVATDEVEVLTAKKTGESIGKLASTGKQDRKCLKNMVSAAEF
jgi:hypothetical protein